MEAKDTVMENLAQAIIAHPDLPMGQAIAIEQAEISFKAGGKEVVEWLRRYEHNKYYIFVNHDDWQGKLKEWFK